MEKLTIQTACGDITMKLRRDAAPGTCDYICKAVADKLYDNTSFYRSDFVIQCGLHGTDKKPNGNIERNETNDGVKISNKRGTAAIAHWDVPDNGNTEFFINLQTNDHLDTVYGGYCVFAEVADDASFTTVDKIADAVKKCGKVAIISVTAS
mmetsp:Transcript_110150/g.206487  ORF Transcript_110150/g.206487 Transcript_110150/m.206487 type:complete len:152 (-) Transcript_110150:86-541(-)